MTDLRLQLAAENNASWCAAGRRAYGWLRGAKRRHDHRGRRALSLKLTPITSTRTVDDRGGPRVGSLLGRHEAPT